MTLPASLPPSEPNAKIPGYRGIWYTLDQFTEYGDKYSGGLGTYTSSHTPLAIYIPEANKTFFTYGGTPGKDQRRLVIMASYFDHATGRVPQPTVVVDLNGVDDPHDNASLALDGDGYIWVFVSGRNTSRPGRIFRATAPHSVDAFEAICVNTFTYPQPRWFQGLGFFHLFTKYTAGRELYWSSSVDGANWTPDIKIAGFEGHYQVSAASHGRVGTAFNRHPDGSVDHRTDLYYMETDDFGQTWWTADGTPLALPVAAADSAARVRDYASENRLVYIHDITYDPAGRPALLYSTSNDYRPGPNGDPRRWEIALWQGDAWVFRQVTTSTHNYDVGFLKIESETLWRIYGPTETGPQTWGTGGEVALWESCDAGATWKKLRDLTSGSQRNHAYVRHPINAHPDFYAFWADGNPDTQSPSYLYFANQAGDVVRRLPYDMEQAFAEPESV